MMSWRFVVSATTVFVIACFISGAWLGVNYAKVVGPDGPRYIITSIAWPICILAAFVLMMLLSGRIGDRHKH